jgi:succinyl-CoA synthetase beta subunit
MELAFVAQVMSEDLKPQATNAGRLPNTQRQRELEMAKLYEYQSKELLRKAGIAIPEGGVATTALEARGIAERIGRPVAIKAQVWATGRFGAGGIKFAANPDEALDRTEDVLMARIKGLPVTKVLVEEKLDVVQEYYAGVALNSSMKVKAPVLVFSTEGGTGIEEIAARAPEKVVRHVIDPLDGLSELEIESMLGKVGVKGEAQVKLKGLLNALYNVYRESDAAGVEVNPVVMTRSGQVYAADCHITLDDNSIFRHPEFGIRVPREMDREPTELEQLAWDHIEEGDYRGTGFFAQIVTEFREGEKYVGFHGIGGGGSMLGAAALMNRGIRIANYTDTSGDPPAAKIYKVIKAIFSLPISAYVITGACLANQEQWFHGFAIVKALREELKDKPGFPVVILLAGNKEAETMEILRQGFKDLDIRLELYGRDYIYRSDYLAERVQVLMEQYLKGKQGQDAR